MESETALRALGALAQETRLCILKLLVRAAPEGVAAGELAERIGLPASTLSFHLQHLSNAGLVSSRRHSRSLVYSLQSDALRELFWFLGEDCCQGRKDLCAPLTERIDRRLHDTGTDGPAAVLFLCSRNSARSQMAEALLRNEAGDRFDIHSGGMTPHEVHPFTLRVLDEVGADTSLLYSKDLGSFLGKVSIHHAIIVSEAANEDCPRIHPFAHQQLYWPFPDPVAAEGTEEERLAVFREVRDAIGRRIQRWLTHELSASPLRRPAAGAER
jgi:arsenate reductase